MSVNRKVVVIYGSTDLWIYWDKADKLRLFYRDISHNLCAKRVGYQFSHRYTNYVHGIGNGKSRANIPCPGNRC